MLTKKQEFIRHFFGFISSRQFLENQNVFPTRKLFLGLYVDNFTVNFILFSLPRQFDKSKLLNGIF
jgi:hypothetical protein